jgi:hypothetical protein
MAPLLIAALLLSGALEDNEAFAQAQSLYRSGDPVAAEVALGPLLDASQAPAERARVLLWAAMCADMSGRMEVAQDRASAAVVLDPSVKLPAEMSLRLAQLVEGVRAEAMRQQAPAPGPEPSAAAPSAPPAPQPAPSAPPAPEASPSAPPAVERSHEAPSSGSPSTTAPKDASQPAAGPPPTEETTVTVSTSLWAVAGAALTVTMLLGAGAAVIAIYAGLTWYETLAPDAMDVAVTQEAVLVALRLSAVLAAAAAVAGLASAGTAGIAWWIDQE